MPVMLNQGLVGHRVVIRYRRPTAVAGANEPALSDVVGELRALTDTEALVAGRRGAVRVPLDAVVIARPVAADRRAIIDLEVTASHGWRAAECVEYDGWLLRADPGQTARANSALPARTTGAALSTVLAQVTRFYADRGLPALVQVPLPARGLLDAELAQRCWTVKRAAIVLTRPVDALPPELPVTLTTKPSEEWLANHSHPGAELSEHAALLTRHDTVRFASVEREGRVVGIARGAVDDGWLGVTAVAVTPDARRGGIATSLMAGLQRWASEEGATQTYLQVMEDNDAAQALYSRLGFSEHHRYHYRVAPEVH
jgi:ribosomal protein S18 acetylase RimI-like enzyme